MTRWNAPGRARPDEPLATWCQAQIAKVCKGRAVVRHHIIRRGPGSSDEAWNTLDLCGDDGCHGHIHRNVEWAKEQGFLRSRPIRCAGSESEVLSLKLVHDGLFGCLVCGHRILVVHHADGGAGAFVDAHNVDGSEARWL